MAITRKNVMGLEDYYYSLYSREDGDVNATALDDIENAPLDNDIGGGADMNTPEDLNDQDSIDDIHNSFHDGDTGDTQNGLEDDELFLNEDDDTSLVDDGGDIMNDASDISGDGSEIAADQAPIDEANIIGDASEQEVPESAVDEANGDVTNPADAMESWYLNLSLEDLSVAISDGDGIDQEITIGDDGSTTVQSNCGNDSGSSSDDDDSSDDDEGDSDLSDLDNDSDDSDDDDDSSDDDEDENKDEKDEEGEESFFFFDEDFL